MQFMTGIQSWGGGGSPKKVEEIKPSVGIWSLFSRVQGIAQMARHKDSLHKVPRLV